MDIENAIDYIFEEKKGDKRDMKKKEVKKTIKEKEVKLEDMSEVKRKEFVENIVENLKEQFDIVHDEVGKEDEFEILEEVVIREVKLRGKNGVYNAKTGLGVALESEGYKLAFSSVAELESFCNEFKKVFERI